MDENNVEKNEIDNNNNIADIKNENLNKIEENNKESNNDNFEILNKLFKKSKDDNSKYIPFLIKSGDEELLKIFTEKLNTTDENSLNLFILKKLNLISQIISITTSSPEILYIIFDYLSKKNISIFKFIIDIYISFIQIYKNNDIKENLFNEIKKIFSNLISLGLLAKTDIDFIYQKIAFFQLEKKLNVNLFCDIIPLLEILYSYDTKTQTDFIANNFFYFYDKETSSIETNISEKKFIQIKKGFSIVLWFYLKEINEDSKYKSSLLNISNEKGDNINLVLNEKNDIDICYKNNNNILKEKQNRTFNIETKVWTQLVISIYKNEINLFLDKDKETNEISSKKLYEINNISFHDCQITEISFFKNFLGIVYCVMFFKEDKNKIQDISSLAKNLYDINTKNLNEKLSTKIISESLYFIFSPNLFVNNQQIIDPKSNIIGNLTALNNNNYNLNSLFSFNNNINNIFYLGGFYNFLPLFEIFYKFTLSENNTNEIDSILRNIFIKLFKLLEIVLSEKRRNSKLSMENDVDFFPSLEIFMKKIDEKYYYNNEKLLEILLNIAKIYNDLKKSKYIHIKENFGYFANIIFNPEIIIKFNLDLQKKLFDKFKSFHILMDSVVIIKLLKLLSQKYTKNETEKNDYSTILFEYIKYIFETKLKDDEKEKLFLLYKNKSNKISNKATISNNIFIRIIRLFIIYLDLHLNISNQSEKQKLIKIKTVEYLLNSNYNFIEILLKYLSDTNIHIKKEIINLLRVLTNCYKEQLDQYFYKLNKKKKETKISKEEFYIFIKENIAPNYNNSKIRDNSFSVKSKRKNSKITSKIKEEIKNNNTENKNEIILDKTSRKEVVKININKKRNKSSDNNEKILKNISNILSDKPKNKRTNSFNILKKNNIELILNKFEKEKSIKKPETPKKEEKMINNNDINIKEELTFEQRVELRDTKLEIALILYNWLLDYIKTDKNKNNKEKDTESINHSIDYIVKFISYTKELDAIYRILILINNQKNLSSDNKDNEDIYNQFLKYFLDNSLFMQLLIELLINSFIYKNIYSNNATSEEDDFIVLSSEKGEIIKLKDKIFSSLYEKSLEILLDIYFLDDDEKKKTDILTTIFLVSLKLLSAFQDNNDINKKNLLLKFVRQMFIEINKNFKERHKKIKNHYLNLFTYFIDYAFILKNVDEFMQKSYKNIKDDRTNCIPDFLTYELIYENEGSYQWAGSDIYADMFKNIKRLFSINNIFSNFEFIFEDINKQKDEQKCINKYEINFMTRLIDVIMDKKKTKDENAKQKRTIGLFYSCHSYGYDNNFPIINIISLFNSLNIHLLYSETNNEMNKEKLINLLNEIQNYILFLLVFSLNITQKDTNANYSYDAMQELIYQNLFFNIQNLFNRLNDEENKGYFLDVLYNVILFLTVIYNKEKGKPHENKGKSFLKSIFPSNSIDLSKTAPCMLLNFYKEKMDKLFNDQNFHIFSENDKQNSIKAIEENIIYDEIKKINNMKTNPSFDLYNIKIFENIAANRENDKNIKLLIEKESKEYKVSDDYKKIYLKIKNTEINIPIDEIIEEQKDVFKIKSYRKLKKDLYSFNNSYSNLQVFYNIPLEQKSYYLKYKVSNFLSKDMSPKFIKPIIDMDFYMPNFRKYEIDKKNLYQHSAKETYTVDLRIFNHKKNLYLYPNNKTNDKLGNKYFFEENVCYIKTAYHIKGAIFHSTIKENMNDNYLFFCITEQPSTEIKLETYEDYDSINESCFNSIFRNNMNIKDQYTYLKLNFDEIIFIFNRKYSFRDNAIEIFTSFHRSYYFKFRTTEKRNSFLEHIVNILNKDSSLFKKLFKPIYSINSQDKKILLGYYKDIDNNSEYGSRSNLKEMWKNSKISYLEFLLWTNIYGNRSFRDISQYPVFPWIIADYKTDTFDEIINNKHIRKLDLPMGLMTINEKAKERKEGYINTYKLMSLDLKDEELVDFKIKDEDEDYDENNTNEQGDLNKNNINNKNNNNIDPNSAQGNNDNLVINNDKSTNDTTLSKIPLYNYNIEKIYKNDSVEYEKIPYLFGSHFSNAMYISHYMGRLFPYSLTMIEIQGSGFDCAERLFICLDKTFISAASEKCDVRELIPEFYYMPEMFLNINKLNFGQIQINNYIGSITYYDELFEENEKKEKISINGVLLPKWCKDNPYYFILKSRELLENSSIINANPWIDLIFGYYQRGKNAQKIGNLYLPCSYDGVMNGRLSDEEILKNRNDSEFRMRLFELGVNPCKVFDKKITEKKKILKQITDIKKDIDKINNCINGEGNINFIANINSNILLLFENDYKLKKISIEDKNESNKGYKTKEISCFNFSKDIFKCDNYYKLYVKYFTKSNMILFAGFYNESIYLISLDKITNTKLNINNANIFSKIKNKENKENSENNLILNKLKEFGIGFITALEISQDEKYIIYGSNKGALVILEFIYYTGTSQNSDNYEIKILKIISSHSGYSINSISINTDLNVFADCSYDNYIHIYTLPKCDKIISIYNKNSLFNLDYIFLSAQPLPSVILYSNRDTEFKVFNIHGHDLKVEQNDKKLLNDQPKNINEINMISPIIFTNWQFSDYLIYIFKYKYILLRKAPLMEVVFKINFGETDYISIFNLSLMKDCIYAVDNNNKKIHVINCEKIINNK